MTNQKETTNNIMEITESAITKIAEIISSRDLKDLSVRVILKGALPGGKFQSEFKFISADTIDTTDIIQDTGKFKLVFDEYSVEKIRGAVVDFNEMEYAAGFHIEYPPQIIAGAPIPKDDWDNPVAIKVQEVITNEINPGVAAHGGWVQLQDVKGDKAIVEMGGGCHGCGISEVTLRNGIEKLILERVPEITQIEDITDHDTGENPYYPDNSGDSNQSALN
jgi:Fe/S biogenesis protein NfuA